MAGSRGARENRQDPDGQRHPKGASPSRTRSGLQAGLADRGRAEEALRESEGKFQDLAEKAVVGIYLVQDGRFQYVNAKFAEIFEYQTDELTGPLRVRDVVYPKDRSLVEGNLRKRLSGELESLHYEFRLLAKSRKVKHAEVYSSRTLYRGRPAVIGTLLDITERRRMAEALENSEKRFRQLAGATFEGIFIHEDARIVDANPSMLQISGYDYEELIGRPVVDFVAPSSRQEVLRNMYPGCGGPLEVQMVRKGGSPLAVEAMGRPIIYDGRQARVVAVRDITERKRMEESLRRSEERFSKAFHISPAPTAITTFAEGRCVDANESLLLMLGHTREEMIGRTTSELKVWADPEDRRRFACMLGEAGSVRGAFFQLRTKTGEIQDVLMSAEIITLDEKAFILTICYGITEQRRLEKQLRQSQKMEAIGTLAGGIAHDFNNILGGIMGYTELIMSHHIVPGHPAYPFLEGTQRGIHRAKELVAQMMTFSRQQEQKRIPLQMGPILKEALKLLRASLPATIRIDSCLAPREGHVFADPTQVHQVLMNLATNAAHAMKGTKGILEISLRPIRFGSDETPPHTDLKPGADYQELVVRDNGHGIDPEVLPRIFDPFFTTKKTGEGTGLGLSVVYGIIKSYGGVIIVESKPGQGTAFRIYIPAITGPLTSEDVEHGAIQGGRERILFVDDESTLTEVFKIQLTDLGYAVSTFNDPLEALDHFGKHPDAYDLVITDMTMPHMTGVDFAGELIRIRPDIPVILSTGMIENLESGRFDPPGIRKRIRKPVKIYDLASAIRRILETP